MHTLYKSLLITIQHPGIGLCMSAVLAGFGLDPTKLETDKLHTILNSEGILTSFLRYKPNQYRKD